MSIPFRTTFVALVAIVFSTTLMAPCLCAAMPVEDEEKCPCSETTPSQDHEHHDCSCGCTLAGKPGESDGPQGAGVLTVTEEEVPAATSWWSPDLLVALFVIRGAEGLQGPATEVHEPPSYMPDQSRTFLDHSTFLI